MVRRENCNHKKCPWLQIQGHLLILLKLPPYLKVQTGDIKVMMSIDSDKQVPEYYEPRLADSNIHLRHFSKVFRP